MKGEEYCGNLREIYFFSAPFNVILMNVVLMVSSSSLLLRHHELLRTRNVELPLSIAPLEIDTCLHVVLEQAVDRRT